MKNKQEQSKKTNSEDKQILVVKTKLKAGALAPKPVLGPGLSLGFVGEVSN